LSFQVGKEDGFAAVFGQAPDASIIVLWSNWFHKWTMFGRVPDRHQLEASLTFIPLVTSFAILRAVVLSG
jgi:hypothetical protein